MEARYQYQLGRLPVLPLPGDVGERRRPVLAAGGLERPCNAATPSGSATEEGARALGASAPAPLPLTPASPGDSDGARCSAGSSDCSSYATLSPLRRRPASVSPSEATLTSSSSSSSPPSSPMPAPMAAAAAAVPAVGLRRARQWPRCRGGCCRRPKSTMAACKSTSPPRLPGANGRETNTSDKRLPQS